MDPNVAWQVLFLALGATGATYGALVWANGSGVVLQLEAGGQARLDRLFVLLPVAFAVVFGWLAIASFLSFNMDGYDLSIFDQVIWSSLHGRLFENTILPDAKLLIGQRFSPILLAFVPLYAVWSSPIVLLVVQTIGIASAGFPVYWLARERLGRALGIGITLALFLFPALEYVNLFEFHELALAIPIFAFAMYLLLHDKYVGFLACMGVALLVKEDMAFVVAMFGLYIFFIRRKLLLGIGLTGVAVLWSAFLLLFLLPFLSGSGFGGDYYYLGHGLAAGHRYDYLGSSLGEVLTTLATRVDVVWQHVMIAPKADYVLALVVPLAFSPVMAPEIVALCLPTLGISLLSDYAPQFSIQYHYAASLLPFLFFGVIIGVERVGRLHNAAIGERRARTYAATAGILSASLASYYLIGPGPLAARFDPAHYAVTPHTALGQALLSTIPRQAVAMAQTEFLPHLSERAEAYGFPSADYCKPEYLFADTTRFKYNLFEDEWNTWLATGRFAVTRQDGYLLAALAAPDQEARLNYQDGLTLESYKLGNGGTQMGGDRFCAVLEWQAGPHAGSRYLVQLHIEDDRGHSFAGAEHLLDLAATGTQEGTHLVLDRYSFGLPVTMPPGNYHVVVTAYDPTINRLLVASHLSSVLGDHPSIATKPIEKLTKNITGGEIAIEERRYVDMHEIRMLGSTPLDERASPGERLSLGIYWRARGVPEGDYDIVLRLEDQSGIAVAEEASRPANGAYPTTEWRLGEVLLDWHDLSLPADLRSGKYAVQVLLRNLSNGEILGRTVVKEIQVTGVQ